MFQEQCLGRPFLVLKDIIPWIRAIFRRAAQFGSFTRRLNRGDPSIDTVFDANSDPVLRRRLKNAICSRIPRTRHRASKRGHARPRPALGGAIGRGRFSHARQTRCGVPAKGPHLTVATYRGHEAVPKAVLAFAYLPDPTAYSPIHFRLKSRATTSRLISVKGYFVLSCLAIHLFTWR
jgi:hypothetical protein